VEPRVQGDGLRMSHGDGMTTASAAR
jgi:hypothetical protein